MKDIPVTSKANEADPVGYSEDQNHNISNWIAYAEENGRVGWWNEENQHEKSRRKNISHQR